MIPPRLLVGLLLILVYSISSSKSDDDEAKLEAGYERLFSKEGQATIELNDLDKYLYDLEVLFYGLASDLQPRFSKQHETVELLREAPKQDHGYAIYFWTNPLIEEARSCVNLREYLEPIRSKFLKESDKFIKNEISRGLKKLSVFGKG